MPEKKLSYYKIYSTSNKFLPYTYLIKTTSNSYEDLINENGATRYYKITIVDKDGLESKKPGEPVVGMTLAEKVPLGFRRCSI